MKRMGRMIRQFVSDEKGLETVEYAIIAALITLAAIATITLVGIHVNTKFEELDAALTVPAGP